MLRVAPGTPSMKKPMTSYAIWSLVKKYAAEAGVDVSMSRDLFEKLERQSASQDLSLSVR